MLLQSPGQSHKAGIALAHWQPHVRVANFALANEAFLQARDQFEPIHLPLRETPEEGAGDPKYF